MEKVKSIKSNINGDLTIYNEHSIYKLTETEMKESGVETRFDYCPKCGANMREEKP